LDKSTGYPILVYACMISIPELLPGQVFPNPKSKIQNLKSKIAKPEALATRTWMLEQLAIY
jgi:hypothetical protein